VSKVRRLKVVYIPLFSTSRVEQLTLVLGCRAYDSLAFARAAVREVICASPYLKKYVHIARFVRGVIRRKA
jgi:hypothetical protein